MVTMRTECDESLNDYVEQYDDYDHPCDICTGEVSCDECEWNDV